MGGWKKEAMGAETIGYRNHNNHRQVVSDNGPSVRTPTLPRESVTVRAELKFGSSGSQFPSPHTFDSKVKITGETPSHVIFSPKALEDMYIIVDQCPEEVSWLGIVQEFEGGFFVDEIHLVEQEVGPAVTEMMTNGLSELATTLLAQEGGCEKINRLRFWGHSHVNMDTFASSQDQDQISLWKKNGLPYLIRAIMNKRGKLQLSIFLFDRGIQIDDAPWSVMRAAPTERMKFWGEQLTAKVKKPATIPYHGALGATNEWNSWGQHGYARPWVPDSSDAKNDTLSLPGPAISTNKGIAEMTEEELDEWYRGQGY